MIDHSAPIVDQTSFLNSLSRDQLIFYHQNAMAAATQKLTSAPSAKVKVAHQMPLLRQPWDTAASSGSTFPTHSALVLEGDNIVRRHYPKTAFTLTQFGENIITSRFPAHLINFSQQPSIRTGEASHVFSADHKLKTASQKMFFSTLKDISVAVEAWSVLCSIYGAFESRDMQGIFTIAAAMQVFIDGSPGRPDIIRAVFHRMMLSCLDGDSPPGFSNGMPALATNVYTLMMMAPDVPAKDISIYLHLSDAMLRELPPVLKASLLRHQLPLRMMSALSNKNSPDLRALIHKSSAPESSSRSRSTEVCRNFNFAEHGCKRSDCRSSHVCASCASAKHSNGNCSNPVDRKSKSRPQSKSDGKTPASSGKKAQDNS
jgi:hypothetical protein